LRFFFGGGAGHWPVRGSGLVWFPKLWNGVLAGLVGSKGSRSVTPGTSSDELVRPRRLR